ncbi:hypothetical protein E2562_022917 [Oryza meyeriana var. granulata]|uniref:Uncharacterized protein n=1 Tax=Oryza meyeriana var. granulata TaxID=110450 RepID=A0A6G1D6S2_9ORYZ|nr:hypothetical protein E2562_022917 [Oryza meyeriana var. granulata]
MTTHVAPIFRLKLSSPNFSSHPSLHCPNRHPARTYALQVGSRRSSCVFFLINSMVVARKPSSTGNQCQPSRGYEACNCELGKWANGSPRGKDKEAPPFASPNEGFVVLLDLSDVESCRFQRQTRAARTR